MIIIGDSEICDYEPFLRVEFLNVNLRQKNILIEFDLLKSAKNIGVQNFSVFANDKIEAVLANAAGAKFIFADRKNLKDFVDLAQNYIFDSKIAFLCHNRDDFAFAIENLADAAVFEKGVIDG